MTSILLIDAHPASGRSAARLLASEGYRVVLASSAAEALDAIYTHEFDLLLIDPALPDLEGGLLLDRLSDEPACAELPVIIIASGSFNRTLWQLSDADLREWFVKGNFSADELMEAVQRHLPGQRMPSLN